MASGYDGSIKIDTSIDGKGFNTGVQSLVSMLKGLAAAVGIAFSVAAIVKFGQEAAQAASDYQVMKNKFDVVFGSLADQVEKQLARIAAATNSSDDDLMGYAATLQNTFLQLGYNSQKAADSSVQIISIARDLATFNPGTDTSTVINAVQDALMGYTRELRNYGIVIDDDQIKAKALSMGLWDGAGAMNAQAKAAATLQIIVDSTTAAQGNAAKTAHTWAGQVSGLTAAWNDFKVGVGNAIIIFAPIVGVIKNALVWLTALANQFAAFLSVLFGVDVDTSSLATNTADAADSAGDLADNTTAAGKAAKGALASFDQLNVLQQATSSDSSGSGTTTPTTAPKTNPLSQAVDDTKKTLEELKQQFLNFFSPLDAPFEHLKQSIINLGGTIWNGLQWAYQNILVPLGTWLVQKVAPVFLDLLANALNLLNTVIVILAPNAQWLWDNFLKPVAAWTGGLIVSILEDLSKAIADLNTAIAANPDGFRKFVESLVALAGGILLISQAGVIVSTVTTVIGAISGIAAFVSLLAEGSGVVATLEAAFPALGIAIGALTGPIGWVILAIVAVVAIIILLINFWPQISAAAIVAWNWVKQAWQNAEDWFKVNVIDPIKSIFSNIWDNISKSATNAWKGLQKAWQNAEDWFKVNVIDPIGNFFGEIWANITQWAIDAWNSISKTWQNVITWFQTNVINPLLAFWAPIWNFISILAWDAWEVIKYAWGIAATWFQNNVLTPVSNFFINAWSTIKQFVSDAWDGISKTWKDVSTWFKSNVIDPVSNWFSIAWQNIKTWASDAWNGIVSVWIAASAWINTNVTTPISNWFSIAWQNIKTWASDAWNGIVSVWILAKDWFQTNVIDPIGKAFNLMLYGADGESGLVGAFNGVWDTIKGAAKTAFNAIIDLLNSLIGGIVSGINNVIDDANTKLGKVPGWKIIPDIVAPKIPRLATGAVIPANSEFLAILGDQKSGKNIEAPEALIRQIIQEEIGNVQSSVTINFDGSMSQLVRALKPYIEKENTRIGTSLIKSGASV